MKRKKLFIYFLGNSPNISEVATMVPCKIGNECLFFGPCKKDLRKDLKERYLNGISMARVTDDIYIVGLNSSNKSKKRAIMYVGKAKKVMTFAEVHKIFKNRKNNHGSTCFLQPLYRDGGLVGYKRISDIHQDKLEWVKDFSSKYKKLRIVKNKEAFAKCDAKVEFDRDCCMVLGKTFWAEKNKKPFGGINLEECKGIVKMIKSVRGDKTIDAYHINGKDRLGRAKPIRRNLIELQGKNVNKFISDVEKFIN